MTRAAPGLALVVAALGAVAMLAPLPARAQDLTTDETRLLAADLIEAGELEAAATVTEALLLRDAADAQALILAARIAAAGGAQDRAADLAARAYAATNDADTRFVAARIAALAQFEQDRFSRAQLWLRRARQVAPNADESQAVAEDYAVLRQLNPLSLDLRFGVRPSSNVNNGSQSETAFLLGLPFELTLSRDARALSGLAFDLGGSVGYRVSETATTLTSVDVSLDATTYALSPNARDELDTAARAEEADGDPEAAAALRDVSGSDYSFVQLSFGASHKWILRDGARPTTFATRVGQTWYGGSPYTEFVDASVGQSVQIGDRSLLAVFAGVQRTFGEDVSDNADSRRLGGTFTTVLDRGDIVSLSLSERVNLSDNPERDFDTYRVGVDYQPDALVLGLGLAFGASFERRDYDFSSLAAGPRRDDTVSLTAQAEIGQVEYYGFRPVANLELSRTTSDIALFDREYISLGFDLRSAF